MLIDLLQDEEFAAILRNHAIDLIRYLFEKDQEFGVVADVGSITFDPPLPPNIAGALQEFSLFVLTEYTFETARLEDGRLVFEAGFGPENFGSVVSIPVEAILQIIVDETPIFVNLTASLKQKRPYKDSMEAFLSNPENKKLLRKKK
jgi:hypothetical protein